MSNQDEVIIWQEAAIGRIRLNRPRALNALSHQMILDIKDALIKWENDNNISAVVIDATGERAFCAGGDVVNLYHTGRADPEPGRQYWRDEYRLNALIGRYKKPYIALMDAIVMGGGVGISAHGSCRIVTEKTLLAMPEVGIGFLPDVGGTYLLARAPGKTGLYLGMTGMRIKAADAIYAGFADVFVPGDKLNELVAMLEEGVSIEKAIGKFKTNPDPAPLKQLQERIEDAFGRDTALGCLIRLEEMSKAGDQWAQTTLDAIRASCPMSVAATFGAIKNAEGRSLEQCLAAEYRFSHKALLGSEFYEGVRAAVVDKDRSPKWSPATLEEITPEMVAAALAPIGDREWSAH
ncbi:3-hydroxyisobutyryl-CoA hydrolase [hydrothermal vent metagenome]|uniref:3-hydroxyisobutyryl-CoA hydrolase n=1 Tax=hydrothermal vent metagenome TaxID=652676 RepID=A0A3B0TWA8_9ZZZZ